MRKLRLRFTCLLLLAFLASNTSFAQISSKEIDQLVEKVIAKFNVAGIAVGIVKDGEIIHSKGYGIKSIETKKKVNKHTLFAIGSNTKAFTTAALAILVDEGKLSWHDKVREHISEFKMYNAYVTENFNIQDLLSHRSGLGNRVGDLMIFPEDSDFTINDIISSFQHFKPTSAFRTQYDYDNLLYLVAGEVVARVSGMSWEEFVKKRIMEPLNMDHSYSLYTDITDMSNVASPHAINDDEVKILDHYIFNPEKYNGAAGSIYSNVDDLCQWLLMHLNKGKYSEDMKKQLFSEANQREMWKLHTVFDASRTPRYNAHFVGYGLGWKLTDIKGYMKVHHGGWLSGMLSSTIMIPDLNLGIIILTNTEMGGAWAYDAISSTIIDSYLGLDDFNWIDKLYNFSQKTTNKTDTITENVWKTVESTNSDHINPENYIGIYEDAWFGKVEVFMNNDQLWFKYHRSPKLNGPMAYYKASTFAIKWEYQDANADAFAIFYLDEEGKAHHIKMKGISPYVDKSFDFHDLDLLRIKN